MWDKIISLIDAILIHVFFLALLLLNINWPNSSAPTIPTTSPNHPVDERAVLEEMKRLKRQAEFNNASQLAQQYALEQKKIEYEQMAIQEEFSVKELRQQQEQERQELEALKQRRQTEAEELKTLQQEKEKVLKNNNF
jgi:membrane protein involved in colicin uptake